jgi:DNA primase
MTLLDLLSCDTTLRNVATTHGGEYAGPCPWCGGHDRFRVWPAADTPGYWCRQCDRKGDAIQWLRDREGLTYREACERLRRPMDEQAHVPSARPIPKVPPLARPPSEAWQARARAFVEQCEQALWTLSGAEALAYLRSRSVHTDILRGAHVGLHVTERHDARQTWGLAPEGNRRQIWLPRGLVFPWTVDSMVWRVTFRRLAPRGTDLQQLGQVEGARHFSLAGSGNTLYGIDTVRPGVPAMLVEAPLNALSLLQEAGDLVAVVAAGGTSGGRLERWIGRLALASTVLLAFDADEAGKGAAAWWLKALGTRAKRWRPYWDDPNAMLQAGADVRTWVREGLAMQLPWWRTVASWPDDCREHWAERASIMEIDGALSRDNAEMQAFQLIANR